MAIYDERERERERVIKRWQASIFACILAIFASLAFTSVTAFADVGDANVSINWGSPDPYSLIPNPSLSEDSDQETSTDGSRVAMFRLYNKWTGEHFYTSSKSERDNIVKAGWVYEQIEWYAPTSADLKPVYRLYNKYVSGGDHHYTTSAEEKDECVKAGWTYEGEGWRTVEKGATDYVKVLRQYNPYAATGTHNYTTDEDEQKYLLSLGWRAEADGGWGGYSKLEPSTPTPATTFTVTFNSNGGTAVAKQTVQSGKTATKPANPTKSGYTFDGWYSDSALTKSFNFSTAITANTTLYAKWKENSSGTPQAFAVYSKDDMSLNFYKRSSVPTEGSKFNELTATRVFTGIESTGSGYPDWWGCLQSGVKTVTVVDSGIQPLSMAKWFDPGWAGLGPGNSIEKFSGLEKIDTSKTEDMTWLFRGSEASSIDGISNWDTSQVKSMKEMFRSCESVTSLDISNWDTSNVTDMGGMFAKCSALTSLDVSKWNTTAVKKTDSMFNLDFLGMFEGCSSLTTLDVANWDTSSMTNMREMFKDCSALTKLGVSNWDTSNVTSMECMFQNCESVTTLDISNWDTSNVTDMGGMFEKCSALTSLDVSKWNTAAVKETASEDNYGACHGMFGACSSLTTLDVANWDTSSMIGMRNVFKDCSALTNLDVSNWNTSNVTSMICMFQNCETLIADCSRWDVSKVKYLYHSDFNTNAPGVIAPTWVS